MKILLIISFVFLFYIILPSQFNAQILKGSILDKETEEPIIGANIFLDGTTAGTVSNINGKFKIENPPLGRYNLIVKMIGFEAIVYPIFIAKGKNISNLIFEMEEIVYELDSVNVVTTEDEEWHEFFDIFEREFLGPSNFSDECKILNPYSIEFNFNEDTNFLVATSDSMLKIENRNLGYKLYTSLISFDIDMNVFPYNAYIKYNTLFEEITPEDEDKLEEWEENRFNIFEKGPRRFLTDVINRTTSENFLTFNQLDFVQSNLSPFPLHDIKIDYSSELELFVVNVPEELQVVELKSARRSSSNTSFEIKSNLHAGLITESGILYLNKNGFLSNSSEVIFVGSWAKYRLSTFLPDNYFPSQEFMERL